MWAGAAMAALIGVVTFFGHGEYRPLWRDKFSEKDGHRLARDMPRRVAISIIEEIGETTPGMANLSASVMR
jgi:hypothetical protein